MLTSLTFVLQSCNFNIKNDKNYLLEKTFLRFSNFFVLFRIQNCFKPFYGSSCVISDVEPPPREQQRSGGRLEYNQFNRFALNFQEKKPTILLI